MNRKFSIATLMILATFGAQAGVKVTSLDLKTSGTNGSVNITLEGRSNELPDFKVNGRTIEVTLSDADTFSTITKSISGAELKANSVNGKAVIVATLPYEVAADKVNLGWKNKNIEVTFPRGKVVKAEKETLNISKPKAIEKETILAKVEAKAAAGPAKETLNEDYLNNLVKAEAKKVAPKADEIKVKQSSIAKTEVVTPEVIAPKSDNFSFAGYAAKFAGFLAIVLGIFYGVVQVLKKGVFNRGKLGFLNNSQMIQVLSTTYIAPKRSLMVVKVHTQIFLVANSESGITFLSEMTDTTGLIKEGEKQVTGTNFDENLGTAEVSTAAASIKLKENINISSPAPEKGIAGLSAKDIVKFSDELKKKAKKLKPIEFN